MDELEIIEKDFEKYSLIKVIGKVTSFTHTLLQDKIFYLLQEKPVCLEMSDITVFASAGIGLLMGATKISEKFDSKLYILNASETILDSFEFTGIIRKLNIIESEDDIE